MRQVPEATTSAIRPSAPRPTVQARFPDGRIFEAPPGTMLAGLLAVAQNDRDPAVAAIVDGRLTDLTRTLEHDSAVTPVLTSDDDGARIYRRSLALLLVAGLSEVMPDVHLSIDHASIDAAALFCRVMDRAPLTQEELDQVAARMHEIVEENAPITRIATTVEAAVRLFEARGQEDTARLLSHRTKPSLHLYELRGRREYFPGPMVPSAGMLKHFALHAYPPAFMLQYPHHDRPDRLPPLARYPKLFAAYEEQQKHLETLRLRGAGELNDAIMAGRVAETSLVAEAFHEARIASIAGAIAGSRQRLKVVLIAGPSSSGKTTFSKRLAIQLLASGLRPFPLALDDYFLDRDRTPSDERGHVDFERLDALDLPLFDDQIVQLCAGDRVELPHYNFRSGKRQTGPSVQLADEQVLVVEGIHGLNPDLVRSLPADRVFRIFVAPLTPVNLERYNRVSTRDTRLVRRIVRDAATRGYDAVETLKRWPSVVAGEKRHIYPFHENSDAMFNSSLGHELAILRPLAEPLLLQVRPESPEWLEANRLLALLQWFRPVSRDVVPTNSILREFIGGSVLDTFNFTPLETIATPR